MFFGSVYLLCRKIAHRSGPENGVNLVVLVFAIIDHGRLAGHHSPRGVLLVTGVVAEKDHLVYGIEDPDIVEHLHHRLRTVIIDILRPRLVIGIVHIDRAGEVQGGVLPVIESRAGVDESVVHPAVGVAAEYRLVLLCVVSQPVGLEEHSIDEDIHLILKGKGLKIGLVAPP